MNTYIESLHWRYATKLFNPAKKVAEADIEVLKDAIRLTASSYGLQPYKVLIIESPGLREKLKPASWNQSQITDASHLFVFVNNIKMEGKEIDAHMENISRTRNIAEENLKAYGNFIKSKTISLSSETKGDWTARQVYIAMGNLLSAAAFLKIDTCPIEGFEQEKVNDILGLNNTEYSATVMVAIGYRSDNDKYQHLPKVRASKEALFETI